jgi:L-rhamnose mutarotase
MTRHVQVTRLRPDSREEYLALHRDVWATVQQRLRDSGIRDYSIWLAGDVLVGTFDYIGNDFESDMAAMAADPETRRWWSYTDPCQVPLPGSESIWSDAVEVWRLTE